MYNSYDQACWWFSHVSSIRELENSVLDSIIDRFRYPGILEQNLPPSINHFKLGQRCIFMGDNDPKHTSGLIQDWLKRKRIHTLLLQSYSPDFNPTENVWDELERRLRNHQPKNTKELESLLIQKFNYLCSKNQWTQLLADCMNVFKWKIIQLNINCLSYSSYLWK